MIEVNTTQYQSAHGKTPRGTGYWMFAIGRNGAWTDFSPGGSAAGWLAMPYSQAKRLAIAEARSLGASIVVVQS